MQVKKNEQFDITIEDMTKEGEGIGKFQGFPFFVKDAVIGDRVKVKVTKAKKNYAYARLEKIIKPGKDRVEAKCPVARQCGGCTLQHLSYDAQLQFKFHKVANCLKRIGQVADIEQKMEPILGMNMEGDGKGPWNYRNKAQFPVGTDRSGNIITGFYAGRSHNIIDQPYCFLQAEINEEICSRIKEFMKSYGLKPYDEQTGQGLVRHILTRVGFSTGQVMVCLIINEETMPYAEEFAQYLADIPGMTSISYNVNCEKTNRILGDRVVTIWGKDTIEDFIGNVRYQISPKSFYQVNPYQTKVLYEKALEYADLKGEETVWDLYCGIGTISLFLAQKAKYVYGVELVPDAIEDARKNAALNGLDNTEFFVGKAEEVLPKWYENHNLKAAGKGKETQTDAEDGLHPDVIVVDPPRKGCDEKCLATMAKMAPKRIVYVSCDPATLARDVKWLGENGYEVKKVCPVDMFPQGGHVESIVALHRTDM